MQQSRRRRASYTAGRYAGYHPSRPLDRLSSCRRCSRNIFLQHIFIEHDVHIAVRIDECAEYGCGADFRFQHRLHELGRRERHMRNTKRLRKILSSKRLIPAGDEKEEIALLVIAEKQRLYHLHVKLFIDRRTVLLLEHGKREEVTEFLEKTSCIRRFISRPGTTTQSCRWLKWGLASQYCRS